MDKPVIKIGVNVFVFQNGKILLGHRIGKVGTGTWCLPGGHLEFGEHFSQGAARELKEETSLEVEDLEFLQLLNQPRQENHYVHINFIAKKWQGEPKVTEPNKFSEWRWFDMSNLPKEIFIGHAQFIPAFLKKLSFAD